jgi:hypothetical protein
MCPKSDIEQSQVIHLPYQSVIGSLMYGMIGARPDIALAIGVVSKAYEMFSGWLNNAMQESCGNSNFMTR